MSKLITGPWLLRDIEAVPKIGKTVFSCFHCGGGSTMGYKLAGYDVLGGVEIDPQMMAIYRANHKPRHSYLMGVQQFKAIPDRELPSELFNLDILDGSPPCSSFSMAGAREKKWGKASKFREGQANQVLDDLFFHFIDIANKLRPKVVIAENVKGLIQGNARGYVKEIFTAFSRSGYKSQLFLLNSATMGVPQRRERTFFIASRADLCLGKINLGFNEPLIGLAKALDGIDSSCYPLIKPGSVRSKWETANMGECPKAPSGNTFGFIQRSHPDLPATTLTAAPRLYHWALPRLFRGIECCRIQSFPDDFNFCDSTANYVCGMSVPPFMMQRVADQVFKQWLATMGA